MCLPLEDFPPTLTARTPHLDTFALVGGDLSQLSAIAKSFLPFPSACLQIERLTGHLSKGGFFEKFVKVYKILVKPIVGEIWMKYIVDAHHLPDSETLLVPDVYAKLPHYSYLDPAQDYAGIKQFYLKMLEDAPLNHSGCHQYVKHSYYKFPKM